MVGPFQVFAVANLSWAPHQLSTSSRSEWKGARHLLEETEQGVEGIASACGFSSAELMRRAFLRTIGIPPSQYRERFCSAGSSPIRSPIQSDFLQSPPY